MRKNFILQHQLPTAALTRFHYVVDFINAHPLKPIDLFFIIDNERDEKDLYYGNQKGTHFSVPIDACFLEDTKTIDTFFPATFSYQKNRVFTAVSSQEKSSAYFYQNHCFGFDIFNTMFFHISRYEEYYASPKQHGQAGWLEEDHHFLIKNNLYQTPLVDQLLTTFFEIITGEKIVQDTTYAISHDVDILRRFTPSYKFFRSLVATVVHRRGWQQLQDSIAYFKKMNRQEEDDPYDYFATLLRSEDHWTHKQIFMMTGGNTKYDNKYRIDDLASKAILQLAIDRGYAVGLHPSYNAGFDKARFADEQKKLEIATGKTIVHNRQHWLRWSWEITPQLFEAQGIQTDSSMGYNRYLGFRCGTGFPYQLYDFKNKKTFSWVEHPMALMESSAIHRAHRTGENLTALMQSFLLKNKRHTHLMLNFHNSNFDPLLDTGRQLRHFYEKELLDLCYG